MIFFLVLTENVVRLEKFTWNLYNVIANSCSFFSGSSGALIHRIGGQPDTFCGLHIGGDFAHCSDCLKIMPKDRHCSVHLEAITSCSECRSSGCVDCKRNNRYLQFYFILRNIKEGFGYNAYSVHHPAFVILYAKYVIPSFYDKVPNIVKEYMKSNLHIIKEHSKWFKICKVKHFINRS